MEQDFEYEFEDELEAMRDMEDGFDPNLPVKGRKSLDFSTPTTKHIRSRITDANVSLNDSQLIPLSESPANEIPPCSLPSLNLQKHKGKENLANTNLAETLHKQFEQEVESQPGEEHQEVTEVYQEVTEVYQNGIQTQMESESQKQSRKRRQDEMFGEMSEDEGALCIDADIPDIVPKTKRPRIQATPHPGPAAATVEDDDDFVISPPPSPAPPSPPDDITVAKQQLKRRQMERAINRLEDPEDRLTANYDFGRQRVHKRRPVGAFMNATGEDGSRVYMKLTSQDIFTRDISKGLTSQTSLQLLGTPLDVLKEQAAEEKRKKLLQESERLSQILQSEEDSKNNEEDDVKENEPHHSLWVERYSPHRYTELLSDESTNRTVLKWLKLWDHVVFNKELKDKKKTQGKDQKKPEQKKFFNRNAPEVNEELDQYKRPQHKIALLSGPPGLGKTTLAHVIAKHAGYNVVEMNASDDRSADVFKQRIEAATQMKAVIGADPKPNCLIIDEIDGAPQPAINMLLTLSKQDGHDTTNKKKRKERGILRRPIICICNDLYVPALRQLRQNAFVINFPQTVAVKLASRLIEIARREGIRTDLTTILALCEKADNDIRSCLNTLQFVKSKSSQLELHTVHSTSLGQKDSHKSLFSVWKQIFSMPRPKRKRYVNPHDRATMVDETEELILALANNNTSLSARFHNTLQMAQAAGEYQKVMQGLYENYLESKVKDPRMDGVLLATEWMQFVDILDQRVGHTQNYTLCRYIPYLPVVFHLLFAANQPHKIQYPHSQHEFHTKLLKTENLVSSMMNEVAPVVRKNLNVVVTVTEVLPPLLGIIQPTLRPVNTQLYSAREKEELSQLVRIMIAYNITYHQERSVEGQYNYVLDPNMEEVAKFPGQKSSRQLTYAAKQLISREIELEKMRRSEVALRTSARNQPVMEEKPGPSKDTKQQESKPGQVPNHLQQTLQPKTIADTEDRPVLDFFGRRIQKSVPCVTSNTGSTEIPKKQKPKPEIIGGDIWFKFKAGFTNAVRRTVRMQDLI